MAEMQASLSVCEFSELRVLKVTRPVRAYAVLIVLIVSGVCSTHLLLNLSLNCALFPSKL